MGFPTVAATATSESGTSTTSHTANLPTGISSGDLLIVILGTASGVSGVTGFTLFSPTSTGLVAYYRVADGTEGSTVAFTTSGNTRNACNSYRITGYTGTPEASASTANSYNVPSCTPSWGSGDTLWIAAVKVRASDYTINAAPTSYGSLIENGNASSSLTSRLRCGSAYRQYTSSSDDPDSFGVSGGSATSPETVLLAVQGTAGTSNSRLLTLLGVGT